MGNGENMEKLGCSGENETWIFLKTKLNFVK